MQTKFKFSHTNYPHDYAPHSRRCFNFLGDYICDFKLSLWLYFRNFTTDVDEFVSPSLGIELHDPPALAFDIAGLDADLVAVRSCGDPFQVPSPLRGTTILTPLPIPSVAIPEGPQGAEYGGRFCEEKNNKR